MFEEKKLLSGESSDDEEYQQGENQNGNFSIHDDDEGEESGADNGADVLASNLTWKDNLAEKARSAYLERQSNTKSLMRIVYGVFSEVSPFEHCLYFIFYTKHCNYSIIAKQSWKRLNLTTRTQSADYSK